MTGHPLAGKIQQGGTWKAPRDADPGSAPGGPGFGDMIEALRVLQDTVTGAAPPPEIVEETTRTLRDLSAVLASHTVPEREQVVGHRMDLPGRGQALVPAFLPVEWDDSRVSGRVTFGRHYLGGNGAVHGGAIPLLFDEVLGRLASSGRTICRTAYLHVNFRRITPVGVELRLEAAFERDEGRKRVLTAALYDGDHVTADAEGLFIALRPGQP
ncbi:PaaI family thioesterase [Peterkaempfera bronchialis]|uniref:PaaI family thioesterase n=1 Tax=Peterkaempfera bronchialis TaxID=2126346 RepID=UPI001E49C708|nr:PaaI family thioesterase [Peterkaempfera bronchialis]